MTDPITPTGETPAAAPQVEVAPETQTPPEEQFDKERAMKLINNLRDVEKQAKKDAKELEQLRADQRKRADAEMTETQRLQKQAEELAAQNAKLQSDLIRSKVVAEVNLPSIFADRLQGSNYEEMLADAKKIAEVLPKQKPTPPPLNPTNPANGELVETEAQKRERLFGSNGKVFDMNNIAKNGGGVVWVQPPENK